MTSIGFGLNIPSKGKKPTAPAGPPTRKPIARKPAPGFFGAGAGSDDEASDKHLSEDEGIFAKSKSSKASKRDPSKPPSKPPSSSHKSSVNADLTSHMAYSTAQTTLAEAAAAAQDPSIYAYDSLYDSMKSADTSSRAKDTSTLDDPTTRRPKYMHSLLAAAEIRKRDLLRAKERMLQKEREAEGDEFKGKESFVTGAYKAQQEEMKRLEEEEAKREEEERKKNTGLTGLYRGMLEKGERAHERAVEAAKEAVTKGKVEGDVYQEEEEKEEKIPLPAHVEVNDEGQVVDKRQLLSGGLNLLTKPSSTKKSTPAQLSPASAHSTTRGYQGKNKIEMERRARQTKMLEEQLEANQKRAREEEEAAAREMVERQVKKGKTEGEVLGAKERYLARKKAREEEERRAKE